MPQVSLYMDDATMKTLRANAKREGVSLSRHVAARLKEQRLANAPRCDTPSGMPVGYFERLYGCIDDDTFVRPDQPDYSLDAERIELE